MKYAVGNIVTLGGETWEITSLVHESAHLKNNTGGTKECAIGLLAPATTEQVNHFKSLKATA